VVGDDNGNNNTSTEPSTTIIVLEQGWTKFQSASYFIAVVVAAAFLFIVCPLATWIIYKRRQVVILPTTIKCDCTDNNNVNSTIPPKCGCKFRNSIVGQSPSEIYATKSLHASTSLDQQTPVEIETSTTQRALHAV